MNLLMVKYDIAGEYKNTWHMSCVQPYKLVCLLSSNFENNFIVNQMREVLCEKEDLKNISKETEFCLFNSIQKINRVKQIFQKCDILEHVEMYIKSKEELKNDYFLYVHDYGLYSCLWIDWLPESFLRELFSQIFNVYKLNVCEVNSLFQMCKKILVIDIDSIKRDKYCFYFSYYTDNKNCDFSKYLYRQYYRNEFQQYVLNL